MTGDDSGQHRNAAKKTGLADSPFFSAVAPQTAEPTPLTEVAVVADKKEEPITEEVLQSVERPTDQPVDRSTSRSAHQSTGATFTVDVVGPVVARPRSFYITQKLNRWLDESVRYLRDSGLHKADRSVLVNTLLHDPDLFTPHELDKLRERLLVHLTNRTLRRSESTR